jgi:uncharacterized protein
MQNLTSEKDIIRLISADQWMIDILHAAKSLELPDWWVCAGFVRTKIWDTLHGYAERTPLPDVDVVYFDSSNTDEAVEKDLEARLKLLMPSIPWSVKNEARMHEINNNPPYSSSVDAISKFPETATALGVTLNAEDQVVLAAPCGIADVLRLHVKPTPCFQESPDLIQIYEQRIIRKNFKAKWPLVTVFQ